MTHYLRFSNEATGMAALQVAGFVAKDGRLILASHNHALDVIGVITAGGEWNEDGAEIVSPVALSGWHINYIGELPDGWASYVVTPEQPVRVFAS
jgi:hypothetical protein